MNIVYLFRSNIILNKFREKISDFKNKKVKEVFHLLIL